MITLALQEKSVLKCMWLILFPEQTATGTFYSAGQENSCMVVFGNSRMSVVEDCQGGMLAVMASHRPLHDNNN